tara:strand:+ start:1289 stop:1480 length:192 start_codon:yes stop_codon:yes gene_type:complete
MKLEKIYSPKKIYKNFYSFAKENSLGKNQILVATIFIFFFTAVLARQYQAHKTLPIRPFTVKF